MPFYDYQCEHCGIVEVRQGINEEPIKYCPNCGRPVEKAISIPSSFINKNKQANQYNDVKGVKYWRDKNGIRHKVTPADGSSNSPTVSSKISASPELVENRIKRDKKATEKRLSKIRHRIIKKT